MRRTRRTYPIVEIRWRSFSTRDIRNLRRRYIGILDDGKLRHGILIQTYWEYSSRFRRKLGEGKYLFSLPNRENHFFYISLFAFLLTISTYQRRGGRGTFCFDSTYASEIRIDRDKVTREFLSSNTFQPLTISWKLFTPCLKLQTNPHPFRLPFRFPYVLPRSWH